MSGEEGGFGVGHAGDEVHDADVGGIEVVFFSGSTNTHEGDGLLFTVADFLAGFQLVDSRDEGVQQTLVEGVRTDLQSDFRMVFQNHVEKVVFRAGHVFIDVFFGAVDEGFDRFAVKEGIIVVFEGGEDGVDHEGDEFGADEPCTPAVGIHRFKPFFVDPQFRVNGCQHVFYVLQADDVQFQCVFHVDDAVADVVCRFGKIRQGMAPVMAVFQAQSGKDGVEGLFFGLVKIEFGRGFADGVIRRARVFDEGGQCRIGQPEAAVVLVVFDGGNDPEALCIAVECLEVGFLPVR